MTKRIISGVFLLIALGALGLILAGALTSGEQLIVRFLTAVIVAALGLYVISDLRLQADDHAAATTSRSAPNSRRVGSSELPPLDSTAAFMATVTGKRSAQPVDPASLDAATVGDRELATTSVDGQATGEATIKLALRHSTSGAQAPRSEPAAVSTGPILEGAAPAPTAKSHTTNRSTPGHGAHTAASTAWTPPVVTDPEESPYQADFDEAELWPFNATTQSATTTTESVEEEVDGLVAIFARKTEQELAKHESGEAKGEKSSEASAGPAQDAPPQSRETQSRETLSRETASGAALVEGVGDFLNNGPALAEADEELPSDSDDAQIVADQPDPEIDSGQSDGSDHQPKVSYVPPTKLTPAQAAESAPEKHDSIAPIIDLRTAQSAVAAAAAHGSSRQVTTVEELEAAIRSGEFEVISSLIQQRLLSTEGPITDRDVSTMVYVAFTSSELRKILLAGGTLDSDLSELDLGDVEVFVDPTDAELEALKNSAAMIDLTAGDFVAANSQAL